MSLRRCPWPEGCEEWCGGDERLCYAHVKHLDGLLDLKDPDGKTPGRPIVRTTLDSAVLSDEQLEIAHLLSALGATDIVVKSALERRRVGGVG